MRDTRSTGRRFVLVQSIAAMAAICCAARAVGQGAGGFAGFSSGFGLSAPNDKPKAPATEEQIKDGENLFLKRWKEADTMSPNGDGLGPVFNARSCVECHGMNRPGGAGSNDHNVDVLTVTPPTLPKHERGGFIQRMAAFDPALTAGFASVRPSVTLHKFGNEPEYGDWRLGIAEMVNHKDPNYGTHRTTKQLLAEGKSKNSGLTTDVRRSDLQRLSIVQRSTPALFGAGLIDQIPDEALKSLADSQAKARNGVKGQVAIGTGGRAGRFGWRGQTSSLQEFVMGACANELGLQVPGHPQGLDPLDPKHQLKGDDLTQQQCENIAAFIASLPRPKQRHPANYAELKTWDSGEQVFTSIGCANCHVRTVASVDGLFSDLLLHDLGPKLADPAGANPSSSSGALSPAYYGGPADVFAAVPPITKRQWRTAPLWGVADSAPYLHDGRAATLSEAIRLHDGEAAAAARQFVTLPSAERIKLVAFLGSLAAPSDEALVATK